jgi:hypothetical protein
MSWMAIDRIDFSPEDVEERLHALFEAAKTADEFEFACTLLRLRGMEDAGWDPFVETQRLVEDLMALIDTPLVGHTKIRLGLLLYSHLTEVGAVYEVLANLSRVHAGERYSIDPFLDYCSRNRKGEVQFLSTRTKVNALKEMLEGAGQVAVVEVLDWFFNPSVRNAFAHADYTLHQDKFRCRSESFEIGGGIQTPSCRCRRSSICSTARWRFSRHSCASTPSSARATRPTGSSRGASQAARSQNRSNCWPTLSTGCTGFGHRPRPSKRGRSVGLAERSRATEPV